MRALLPALLAAFFLTGPALAELPPEAYRITPTSDPAAPFGVYIPKDLDDAFGELKKMLSLALVRDMRYRPEGEMAVHHQGLGRWLRNNWGLWTGSRLSKYFNDLGIDHPDDMSAIILDSFWRHLNDRPLDLQAQIAYYKAYWEKAAKDKPRR